MGEGGSDLLRQTLVRRKTNGSGQWFFQKGMQHSGRQVPEDAVSYPTVAHDGVKPGSAATNRVRAMHSSQNEGWGAVPGVVLQTEALHLGLPSEGPEKQRHAYSRRRVRFLPGRQGRHEPLLPGEAWEQSLGSSCCASRKPVVDVAEGVLGSLLVALPAGEKCDCGNRRQAMGASRGPSDHLLRKVSIGNPGYVSLGKAGISSSCAPGRGPSDCNLDVP